MFSKIELFNHLDELLESENTNSISKNYIIDCFDLNEEQAGVYLNEWMLLNKPRCEGCEE